MNRLTVWIGVCFVVSILLILGCRVEPESLVNEARYTAVEYSFEGPETIESGWTRLTLDNQGELAHDLWMIKLEEGKTLDDVMAALQSDGIPEWTEFYGQITAQPGEEASYMTNLTPGSYVILSFGQAEDGPPDAAQGMLEMVTVTEADSAVTEADLPQSELSIDLVDFDFRVAGAFTGGEQLVRVSNIGSTLHEMALAPLLPETTFAEFEASLATMGEDGPQGVGEPIAFMMVSPGVSTYVPLEFEEGGRYVLICFLPDAEGTPHYERGMVHELTIE